MDISLVIDQLRRFCPALGGRVGGAADFENGTETVVTIMDPRTGKLAYPSAVVIPLEDEPGGNDLLDGTLQTVVETVGIIAMLDATADRRGQTAASGVEALKYQIFRALHGWNIDPARGARGLYYAGGELLTFDRARLFWMYRMSFEATITDADGFQPGGDPLMGIVETIHADDPLNLGPPIVAEQKADPDPALWDNFAWDDGADWAVQDDSPLTPGPTIGASGTVVPDPAVWDDFAWDDGADWT